MIVGIIIGVLLCGMAYLGKMNFDLTRKLKEKPKPVKKKLTKEQKEKIEKFNKSFEELMEYGYEIALRSDD